MNWIRRIIEWAGLDDDPFEDTDPLRDELEDANERAFGAVQQSEALIEMLAKERLRHRQTALRLATARREVAALRRLILAYESITPRSEAEKFARVIDDVNAAMKELRDERGDAA